MINALMLVSKKIENVKLVCVGAGAGALSCLDLLEQLGLNPENITLFDQKGVVHKERENLDQFKGRYANNNAEITIKDALKGADIFLGLSTGGIVEADIFADMNANPIVFALANPLPEVLPEKLLEVRPDAIIATGRSDYPNQINNVLCFPFIFRGALDVGAKVINNQMKLACVQALADLVLESSSDIAMAAYSGESFVFGKDYIIPKPFDPRLLSCIAPAVAKAAMNSGVATRPIADLKAYTQNLRGFVYKSGMVMRPLFDQAGLKPKTVVFSQGDDERVLRAAQEGVEEGFLKPILIADQDKVNELVKSLNLKLVQDSNKISSNSD
jgi:malate dehydrogenase (oxaloacetate-decarboxylating)(NADP+)